VLLGGPDEPLRDAPRLVELVCRDQRVHGPCGERLLRQLDEDAVAVERAASRLHRLGSAAVAHAPLGVERGGEPSAEAVGLDVVEVRLQARPGDRERGLGEGVAHRVEAQRTLHVVRALRLRGRVLEQRERLVDASVGVHPYRHQGNPERSQMGVALELVEHVGFDRVEDRPLSCGDPGEHQGAQHDGTLIGLGRLGQGAREIDDRRVRSTAEERLHAGRDERLHGLGVGARIAGEEVRGDLLGAGALLAQQRGGAGVLGRAPAGSELGADGVADERVDEAQRRVGVEDRRAAQLVGGPLRDVGRDACEGGDEAGVAVVAEDDERVREGVGAG
jgi:hypothetical protein